MDRLIATVQGRNVEILAELNTLGSAAHAGTSSRRTGTTNGRAMAEMEDRVALRHRADGQMGKQKWSFVNYTTLWLSLKA